nr:MAG TPA: hypothetical protein [Caudoviricetes sp.]
MGLQGYKVYVLAMLQHIPLWGRSMLSLRSSLSLCGKVYVLMLT